MSVRSVATSSLEGFFFFFFFFPRRETGGAWEEIKKISVESASAEAPDARGGACAGQREARPELRALFLPAGECFRPGSPGSGGWQVVVSRLGGTQRPRGLRGFRLVRGTSAGRRLRPPCGLAERGVGREGVPSGFPPGRRHLPLPRTARNGAKRLCRPRFGGVAGNVHPPRET